MAEVARCVGIDVGGRRRGFHLAFADDHGCVALARVATVDECRTMLRTTTDLVAIDAPAAWAPPGEQSRPCERAFQQLGYCNIRFTPDAEHAAQRQDNYYEWIEHGLELWAACRDAGIEAIECFPTASWTAWFGPRGKTTRAAWTTRSLAVLTAAGLRGATAIRSQDDRDALAAALTAQQWHRDPGTTVQLDELVVPRRGTWPLALPCPDAAPAVGRLDAAGTAPEVGASVPPDALNRCNGRARGTPDPLRASSCALGSHRGGRVAALVARWIGVGGDAEREDFTASLGRYLLGLGNGRGHVSPSAATVSSSTAVKNVAWNRLTRLEKPTTKHNSMIWSWSKWAARSAYSPSSTAFMRVLACAYLMMVAASWS